tara:strand:- start:569 stop:904 length:336 start_codon:yes stop_codon:yes gene_type:complete
MTKKENKTENKTEKVYQENWKDIIEKDGVIDLEQVKLELADFSFLIEQACSVYSELVGLSKPNYPADIIIKEHNERYLDKEIALEDVKDLIKGCSDKEELSEELLKYFKID